MGVYMTVASKVRARYEDEGNNTSNPTSVILGDNGRGYHIHGMYVTLFVRRTHVISKSSESISLGFTVPKARLKIIV